MARQNHGPLSRAKGKLGGVVYQQYEGMQVAREYQPVVKNPQTSKQTANRAKFKFASQLVAQFDYIFNERLAKLSIYKRTRRGAAINAIAKSVSMSGNTSVSADITDIVNAINGKSLQDFPAPSITPTAGTKISIVASSGDIVFVTMAGYDDGGNFVTRTNETYISDGTSKDVPVVSADSNVYMVVALRATTEEGRASITNIAFDTPEFVNYISRAVAAGDVLVSALAGGNIAGA